MMVSTTVHTPDTLLTFERAAEAVLGELRPALAEVIQRLRPPVRRTSELRRLLNLGQKVSWGLFNAATATDPRVLPSLLPGRRAMERFFEASAMQGVPSESIERARSAFDRFEELVERHAGSRDAFETMVGELAPERPKLGEATAADLKHKRTAYRSTALLWGRQARVVCGTMIAQPAAGDHPGLLDQVLIRGMVGLRRTRRGVPLHTMALNWRGAAPGDPAQPNSSEPLDPSETGAGAVGLLHDFGSRPLPEFRLRESNADFQSHEIVSENLGASGEVTYFIGNIMRAGSLAPGSVPGAELTLCKSVDIPIEAYLADFLLHRSIWDTALPDVKVFASPTGISLEFRDSDLLPLTERAEYLGDGLYAAKTPLIPQYEQLLAYAMERTGWKADEFRVFRCRVDYPVLSSRIRMTFRR